MKLRAPPGRRQDKEARGRDYVPFAADKRGNNMNVKDFDFELPQELIAQDPLADRSSSRLLILDKKTGALRHEVFRHITDELKAGDCLVINNTKVIPARLLGIREETGAAVETLLLKRRERDVWEVLTRPGKKTRPGTVLSFGGGLLQATVLEVIEDGNRLIRFQYEGIFEELLDRLGQMPLPPYITHELKDKSRYQTVYAGPAFYKGAVGRDRRKGRTDRPGYAPCGPGNLPPGEGGRGGRAPYAFGILSG